MTYNTCSNEWRKRRFFSHKNMTTPQPDMTPDTTYKVLRLTTEGWTEVDNINAVNLTKAQCDQVIQNLIADGVKSREIKAVRDN